MLAILKREIKNYLKHPLFWIGVIIVICGVYSNLSPYLDIRYLKPGETIVNDYPETIHSGEVYEGYVPSLPEERRYYFEKNTRELFMENWEMTPAEADAVIDEIKDMSISEACEWLEQQYSYVGAIHSYQMTAYKKGTADEINSYLAQVMERSPSLFTFRGNSPILRDCLWASSQQSCCPSYSCRIRESTPMSFSIPSPSARGAM